MLHSPGGVPNARGVKPQLLNRTLDCVTDWVCSKERATRGVAPQT
jgi:hypothetical protein